MSMALTRRRMFDEPPSQLAIWARRLAIFAVVVAVLAIGIEQWGGLETIPMLVTFGSSLALALFALQTPRAVADNWPARTVKVVVPYGPGGISDVVARMTADIDRRPVKTWEEYAQQLWDCLVRPELRDGVATPLG